MRHNEEEPYQSTSAQRASLASELQRRHDSDPNGSALIFPGAFNGLVGRAVADFGFPGAYVSGGAVTASKGVPDIGVLDLSEFCGVIREVSRASGLPIFADADTGFGSLEMTARTVVEYHYNGAGGLHIEDQVFPKRCGHLDGKQVISLDEMIEKLRTAVLACDRCCKPGTESRFLICARTDARHIEGFEKAVERSRQYVQRAGVQMLFPEGLTTKGEFEEFATAIRKSNPEVFLVANMTEFGKSPALSAQDLGRMGYDMVIFPVSTLRSSMGAVQELLAGIKTNSMVPERLIQQMQTRQDMYVSLKYSPGKHWWFPSPSY